MPTNNIEYGIHQTSQSSCKKVSYPYKTNFNLWRAFNSSEMMYFNSSGALFQLRMHH